MMIQILSRKTNLEKFTSFLVFPNNPQVRISQWQISKPLEKNYNLMINKEDTEQTIFFHWLKLANAGDCLAKQHLAAYLDEACYWAAKKTTKKLNIVNLSETELFWEAFRIARDKTLNLEYLSKKFTAFNPTLSSLKHYSEVWLKGVIIDAVYLEYGMGKYSDWGLLKNTTKKAIKEALEQVGYTEQEIMRYLMAWQCYKDVYAGNGIETTRKIQEPAKKQIDEIVTLYNLRQFNEKLTANQLKAWLNICINAVREYEKGKRILNHSCPLPDYEIDEEVSNHNQSSLPTDNEDFTISLEQLYCFLLEEFQSLTSQEQKIISLAYGLELNQTNIAEIMNQQQYQVSRQLKQLRRKIIKNILKKINLCDNSKLIETASNILESWLNEYCKSHIIKVLETSFKQLNTEKQTLLSWYFGSNNENLKLGKNEIEEKIKIESEELSVLLNDIQKVFYGELKNYIENTFGVSLDINHKQIVTCVDEWLSEKALYNFLIYG